MRVYAEDPDQNFLPQSGTIEYYGEPSGPGVRVDSGVDSGTEASIRFDPLLAKLIAWGSDRREAISRLRSAIAEFVILGTRTNLSYLRRIISHPGFAAGELSTAFVVEHARDLGPVPVPEAAAIAAVLAGRKSEQQSGSESAATRSSVWELLGDWGR